MIVESKPKSCKIRKNTTIYSKKFKKQRDMVIYMVILVYIEPMERKSQLFPQDHERGRGLCYKD